MHFIEDLFAVLHIGRTVLDMTGLMPKTQNEKIGSRWMFWIIREKMFMDGDMIWWSPQGCCDAAERLIVGSYNDILFWNPKISEESIGRAYQMVRVPIPRHIHF